MKTIAVVLDAFPPSVNNIYYARRGTRSLKKEQVKFRAMVGAELLGKKMPSDWEFVDVDIILTPPNKIRRDVDNYTKAIFDALTNAGYWGDDSMVASVSVQFTKPDKKVRTLIFLRQAFKKYQSTRDCLDAIGVDENDLTFVNRKF